MDFSLPWSVTQLSFLEGRVNDPENLGKILELCVLLLGTWFEVLDPGWIQDSVAGLQIADPAARINISAREERHLEMGECTETTKTLANTGQPALLGAAT